MYLFNNSELGRLKASLPLKELGQLLPKKPQGRGAPAWFDNEGMIALMFLKAYTGLSDAKLIARFNYDYGFQLFCGKLLAENKQVKDKGILSRIRCYLSVHLDMEQAQRLMAHHWRPWMEHTHMSFMDATCYESHVRYPTDVKLLWECCQWVFEKALFPYCKTLGMARPRSKYTEQITKQRAYNLKKRKTYKLRKKRKGVLLRLLEKGLGQLQDLLDDHPDSKLTDRAYRRIGTIKTVLRQQQLIYGSSDAKVKDRIVSLAKPYLRPILRGKEVKRVEFGMKAHIFQVDGISFIDKLSFDAFNESTRLKPTYINHRKLFNQCYQIGADRIYANNPNRTFLTSKKVATCFVPKGRNTRSKSEKLLKKLIALHRSTVLEGAFGNHKNHYGLQKIKARTAPTERLWVFFSIMTANGIAIAKRGDPKYCKRAA